MNIKFFPDSFKDKFSTFEIFVCINFSSNCFFFVLSLFTFSINDKSFLTSTNLITSNIFGSQDHICKLHFIFFWNDRICIFTIFYICFANLFKTPKYFFIRFLIFLISLVLIPQLFIFLNIQSPIVIGIDFWSKFSDLLFSLHQNNYLSYILSIIGLILFILSQDVYKLFSLRQIKINNPFKSNNSNSLNERILKKNLL